MSQIQSLGRGLFILVLLCGLLHVGGESAFALECVRPKTVVVTSDVVVMVYAENDRQPLEGVEVKLWWRRGRSDAPTAQGLTDKEGHLRVIGVAPGDYELTLSSPGFSLLPVNVRVARRPEAPARMVRAFLGVSMGSCGSWGAVAAAPERVRAPR